MADEMQCETCVWYDRDNVTGEMVCGVDMDEDELVAQRMQNGRVRKGCPYYRYYDEYKSVQKQN